MIKIVSLFEKRINVKKNIKLTTPKPLLLDKLLLGIKLSFKGKAMCMKFSANTSLNELWTSLAIPLQNLSAMSINYNVMPGDKTPVIHSAENGLDVTYMKWGLIPHLHSLDNKIRFMNAEIETIKQASFFHNLFDQKRCLIPMSGFYEVDHKIMPKQPYYFYLPYRELFTVAGIWNTSKINGKTLHTFSLLTKKADANVECIHSRMPVIITPANHQQWLENADFDLQNLLYAPPLFFYNVGDELSDNLQASKKHKELLNWAP